MSVKPDRKYSILTGSLILIGVWDRSPAAQFRVILGSVMNFGGKVADYATQSS